MTTRRSRRLSSAHQNPIEDEEFTSGEKFVFELDQSVSRVTRSRRSSSGPQDVKPTKKARRQTMLPVVTEEKSNTAVQKTKALTKKVAPAKPSATGKKAMAVSPTKKFSKTSAKTLKEEDILEKLDLHTDVKTASPVSNAKSPRKSRIPIKSPPSGKKQMTPSSARRSRRLSGDIGSLPQVEKPTAKKRRQTMLPPITEQRSPIKSLPQSPKVENVLKDVKKVEIKLRKMKIKEDPNLIFSLLEDSADEDRVESVVGEILKTKKESSPVTRQRKPATPKPAVQVAAPKTPKTQKTQKTQKTEVEEVKSSKKRKQTEDSVKTPVQNKRAKLDKSGSETENTPGGSLRKTPTPLSKYKQKTPVGSLRKPLKRLQVSKCTPAQVRPSDVLKRNMIRKVEKEIVAKLSKKPDSSPYTLASGENSPVFRSVKDVKGHITGTPARSKPRRKFGTVVQPCSLLEDSVGPGTEIIRRVSSSTPVRPNRQEPHPLEAVEATPIRPPPVMKQPPQSPPPEMVTGKLGSLCSIM